MPGQGESDLDLALEAWRAEHGAGWELDVNPASGFGDFLYGSSARLGDRPADDEGFFQLAAASAIATFPLHGIEPETLVLERIAFLPLSLIGASDKTTVRLAQEWNGVRVEEAFFNVLMDSKEGYLLSVQSTAMPGLVGFSTESGLASEAVLDLAREQLLSDEGVLPTELSTPKLVITRFGERDGEPVLNWRVQATALPDSELMNPVSRIYWFDAQTGALLRSINAIQHFDYSGTVTSLVTSGTGALHAGSAAESKPMSRMKIYRSSDNQLLGVTNEDGTFTLDQPGTSLSVYLQYEGTVTQRVQNEQGPEHAETWILTDTGSNDIVLNLAATEDVTAQANAYYWVTRMHDWISATNPTDDIWEEMGPLGLAVNINETSYDCDGGFFAGSGSLDPSVEFTGVDNDPGTWSCETCSGEEKDCTNNASSTVIAHETGHLLSQLYMGDLLYGHFSEGMADLWSVYLTDQGVHAPNICLNHPECVTRRGDNAFRYCTDNHGGCHKTDHYGGGVLMGAFWKMRERLKVSEGVNGGFVADVLFNAWVNAYNEQVIRTQTRTQLLVLDDGPVGPGQPGLGDGTPHWANINLGFTD